MITIPASIRNKYQLKDGQPLVIIAQENKMVLIPIIDLEKERDSFLDSDAMKQILDQFDDEEIHLENI
jgi:bifunctional DNA-binding transcriptional regulator/antitoxin component of YhaV-PrlF toxin-antitoxin module